MIPKTTIEMELLIKVKFIQEQNFFSVGEVLKAYYFYSCLRLTRVKAIDLLHDSNRTYFGMHIFLQSKKKAKQIMNLYINSRLKENCDKSKYYVFT